MSWFFDTSEFFWKLLEDNVDTYFYLPTSNFLIFKIRILILFFVFNRWIMGGVALLLSV